jgi:hypothetical protein
MPLTTPLLKSELLTSKAYDKIVEKSRATVPARFVIVVKTAYMTPSLLLGQTMTLYIIQTVRNTSISSPLNSRTYDHRQGHGVDTNEEVLHPSDKASKG